MLARTLHEVRLTEKISFAINFLTMANGPAVKPWCKDDKNRLQKPIHDGKVDITKTDEIEYIAFVFHKYFHEQESVNFHHRALV